MYMCLCVRVSLCVYICQSVLCFCLCVVCVYIHTYVPGGSIVSDCQWLLCVIAGCVVCQ